MIALLILGPLADSFVCLTDETATATATVAAVDIFASSTPVDTDHKRGDPGLCAHGHCHHGASFALASAGPDGALSALNDRLSPRRAAALISIATQRLDDPPRA